MGKVLSVVLRPLREYNLENRAHKVISKDKPTLAPKHKIDPQYQQFLDEYPKVDQSKNETLNKFLQDVYVTSQDPMPQVSSESSSTKRSLPLNREIPVESEFGFREPTNVPYGRATLKSALKFISAYQTNPEENSIKKIVNDYKLKEETLVNILKYYRVFEIYIPSDPASKSSFAGPLIPRKKLVTRKPKQLTGDKSENENNKLV
ncbi:hypothetical protein RI129_001698 [Pyrocoelia pectoralis]|uniref:Protein NDUFAF4 homolog n=1 Tax=Pyrocoelia pectoralis TaxID=417401 RepID=A0AAN7VW44_9COLE